MTLSLQDGFVLKRSVFQPCLELYPMDQWNLMQKINKLNRFVKKIMILFAGSLLV
jgi:MraZ protein